MKKEFLNIGKIVGTHGVRGMVRIEPFADSADFLTKFKKFYINEEKAELTPLKVVPHGRIVIASFKDTDSIEKAELLRNKMLYVKRDDVALPEGKYFIAEILNSTVYNAKNGKELGVLSDVFSTGANDVWQITKDNKEYLLPAIPDVIDTVDIESGKITINPLKGIFTDED